MKRRVRIHLVIHFKGGGLSKEGTLHVRSSRKARGMGRAAAEQHPAAMLVLRESEVRTAGSRRGEPEMGTEAPQRKWQIAKRRVEKGDLLWRIREWAGGHTTWQRK